MKNYDFGNYICALRRERGLSQFQLGTLVGVTDKAVSKWENGDAKPKISTCFRLAAALNVPLDDLLSCKEHPNTLARKEMAKINENLWEPIYGQLKIYGNSPPPLCWSRLAAEEAAFKGTNAVQGFTVLGRMNEQAKKVNSLFIVNGAISSSFAAWLLGATMVNPLPPHYRCPKCGTTIFDQTASNGFDLPRRYCTCGEEFLRDGHNIPFEGYANAVKRGTHIELRVSEKFKPYAIAVIEEFYKDKAEVVPVKYLARDKDSKGVPIRYLAKDKSTIDMDKYLVLQKNKHRPKLEIDGSWHVGATEYGDWIDDETSFFLIVSDELNEIQSMLDSNNVRVPDIQELTCPQMTNQLFQKRKEIVPCITDALTVEDTIDFDLLLKVDGLRYATNAWESSTFCKQFGKTGAQLFDEGQVKFREIPAFREDIWNDISKALMNCGIKDAGLAQQVMELIGKFCRPSNENKFNEIQRVLLSVGMPKWYPDYLKSVMYLFPKGHCITHLLIEMVHDWCLMNHHKTTGY